MLVFVKLYRKRCGHVHCYQAVAVVELWIYRLACGVACSLQKPLRRVPIVDIAGGTPLKEEWVPTGRVQQPELPPPPTTSYQFQVDWRQLAPFPELRYKYLKQLDASKIGAFFREAMESELFCEILCILENQFLRDGVDVYPILRNLPKVGRFSTLVMLLGGEDRKRLARLLAVTSKADPGLADSYGL